jgi:2'-5' RNA ligase
VNSRIDGDEQRPAVPTADVDANHGAGRPKARLFLALWPTPQVRERLLAWRDAFDWPAGAAVVAADKLHLTLHFIGPVARERIDEVGAGLAVAAGSFELRFGRAELWPGGIAVLRPLACPDALLALHRRLGDALRALGLPTEARRYRPHVTFARKAFGAALRVEPAPLRWRVRSHALVESRPGRGGGYVVLRRYG